MESTSGRDNPALIDLLLAEAHRFDFYQAVRILNRAAATSARAPVGEDAAPRRESARFRAMPSHAFPAGAIAEVTGGRKGPDNAEPGPPEVTTAFFGLTGPSAALPAHYTSLLIERIRAKDYALRDFLDLFHHRATSLFYRAWRKYRFPFGYEQSCWSGDTRAEDPVTDGLYSLLGLGTGGLRARLSFDDEALLYYVGHFAHYPRSAVALERILADCFAMPVGVAQFIGVWLYLSDADQSSLPCPLWPRGLNTELGRSVVVGQRVWDVEGKFRIRLGPVGYAAFQRLMPSGDVLRPLSEMVRTYAGPQFVFDVQVVLHAAEVPHCRLGGDGAASRLGWNTWIAAQPFTRDATDAVFTWEG
jgi:type VI secretion system protein ImpH